jgi:hypothetical protein
MLMLALITSLCIVLLGGVAPSSLRTLYAEVATLRRVPRSADDNVAAAAAFVLSLPLLFVIDYGVCMRICRDVGARWFLLHGLGNMIVAVAALPDFYFAAQDPPASLSLAYCHRLSATGTLGSYFACSDLLTSLIIAMHVYHTIAFKLSSADLFHHLLFVPLIGGVHFCYPWGVSGNILCFFISGFPGGLDYLMLAAVKSGVMSSFSEKHINTSINTWVRGPGITAYLTLALTCWLKPPLDTPKEHLMPFPPMIVTCFVIFFNGQYYAQRVIGNYYIRKAQDHAKRGLKGPVDLHAS